MSASPVHVLLDGAGFCHGAHASAERYARGTPSCATLFSIPLSFRRPAQGGFEVVHARQGKSEAAQRRTARNQAGNRDRSGSLEEPLQRRELLLLSGGALHQQGNVFGGGLSSSAQELRAPAAPEVSARRLHGRGRRVPAAQEFSERTDGLDRTENVGAQALCAPHQRFLQTPHQDAPRIGDGRGCDGSGRRTAPRDRGESSASFVGGRSA